MERFNDFLREKVDKKEMQKLHVVILGLGDEEGTFADIVQKLSKKYNITHTMIDVKEAYISSSDIEIGEVLIKNIDGEEEARTNGFNILSGTGRWKFLIGQKCIGATARISDFKEGTKNAAFEWKGKCNIPDDKYFRFKEYKKN